MRPRRWRWRLIGALLIVVAVVSSLVVGWAQPGSSQRPGDQVTVRLELLPVTSVRLGRCRHESIRTVWSASSGECLTLGNGLIVTHPRTAKLVQNPENSWDVVVFLDSADTKSFASMTAKLSQQRAPKNLLALMIGDPPAGDLLGSPAVAEQINNGSIDLFAGTHAQAQQFLDRITG